LQYNTFPQGSVTGVGRIFPGKGLKWVFPAMAKRISTGGANSGEISFCQV